jgi:hypothetical protein
VQFQVLMEQVKKREDEIEAIAAGIGHVLDNIGLPQPEDTRLPRDGPHRSIIDRCHDAWLEFKEFTRSVAHGPSFMPLRSCVHITRRLTYIGLQPGMRKVQMRERLRGWRRR